MSVNKRIAFGVAVAWLSRAVTILTNLVLMPVLFRFMGKEELGLWFLLGNSQAFLALLGMGIAPTLMRQIALAKGKSGADLKADLSEESKQEIGDLVVTGRVILQILAIAVFFIAWASGYLLTGELELKQVSPQTLFWSWLLMCAGYAIGVWVSYLNCWLVGIGYVGLDGLIQIVVAMLTVVANILVVILGGGLLALAAISVAAGLVQRFATLAFIRWRQPQLLNIPGKWNYQLARAMIKPSLYCWLTSVGVFLILRTDQYFIAVFSGAKEIPSYNAAYQLVSNLRNIAVSFSLISATFISHMWQAGELDKLHQLILKNTKIALIIMASGVSFLLASGKELTDWWLGENVFVGYPILITFCLMFTFEVQNVCLMYSARATGYEEYATSYLAAGGLNIIFTILLIKPLGLWGVSLGTLISLMLTNNWYAVYKPMLRLKLNFNDYLKDVVLLWFVVFGVSSVASFTVKLLLITINSDSPWIITVSTASTCGIVFLLFTWNSFLKDRKMGALVLQKINTKFGNISNK